MSTDSNRNTSLLRTIIVQGPDARAYLQGQLSADIAALTADRVQLASCNSPQGRVQALIWMIERPEGLVLIVPAAVRDATLARLRKYVLRAKAQIESGDDRLQLHLGAPRAGVQPGSHRFEEGLSTLRLPGMQLTLRVAQPTDLEPIDERRWRAEYIAAGLPQVYPETHEAFVAQMLNVDLLGGISFEKGCYTGQEIIARTHYRGTVKRRMLRFAAPHTPPTPGTRVLTGGQHAGDVVDAVATESGCELLAVISLAQAQEPLHVEGHADAFLVRLPLPYAVDA